MLQTITTGHLDMAPCRQETLGRYAGGLREAEVRGHIAKSDWKCGLVPTHIDLTQFSGLVLYLCKVKPPKNADWIFNNCAIKGDNVNSFTVTKANKAVTRYVPPLGHPGAHGNGWYIAVATWRSHGPHGQSALHVSYSNAVELHG